MTMTREIEIKFKIEDSKAIEEKLKEIGAKKLSRTFERNIIFDTKDERSKKEEWLLRLRRDREGNWLTFKYGRVPGKFKDVKEINLKVESSKKMQKVLEKLGFSPKEVYEKMREAYEWKGVGIFIDKFSFGQWLEIEKIGKGKRDIKRAVKALGLKLSQGSNKTYIELYHDWCRKNKIKPRKKILL